MRKCTIVSIILFISILSMNCVANPDVFERALWPDDRDSSGTLGVSIIESVAIRVCTDVEQVANGSNVDVVSGDCIDPYTGESLSVADAKLDRIVSLEVAHMSGAHSWDQARRTEFAMDPMNLVLVSESTLSLKRNEGINTWLPSVNFQCEYVRIYAEVKRKYDLHMSSQENDIFSQACLVGY